MIYYSFSRLLKHISWNYASYSQNSKHKSITSHPITQTTYFQVKMKLYTQNHSLLLKNQTLPSDITHKPSKTHTLQHSLTHWWDKFKTILQKPKPKTSNKLLLVVLPLKEHFTWWTRLYICTFSIPLCTVQYNTPNNNKKIFCPSITSLVWDRHHRLYWP